MKILLLGWLLAIPSIAEAAPRTGPSAEKLYEQGIRQMRRGYYTKALDSFNRVRNYHRDDPISVKAQLAIADVYYKKGDFEQARFAYEEFSSYHPRHENLDYVTWRIGQSIYRRAPKAAGRDQAATKGAVNTWTGFERRFPESKHNPEVKKLLTKSKNRLAAKELAIAKFYARRKAWGSVRGRTEYLLKRYKDSEHAPTAMRYLGKSLHAWGFTEEATAVRSQLAEASPESRDLKVLDRALRQAPGTPPDEKIFIRPYRIRGGGAMGPG